MTIPGSAKMKLVNEITEIASRIEDLTTYTTAFRATMTPAEAQLIRAQANAMGLYSEVLAARLYLHTGVKP